MSSQNYAICATVFIVITIIIISAEKIWPNLWKHEQENRIVDQLLLLIPVIGSGVIF